MSPKTRDRLIMVRDALQTWQISGAVCALNAGFAIWAWYTGWFYIAPVLTMLALFDAYLTIRNFSSRGKTRRGR